MNGERLLAQGQFNILDIAKQVRLDILRMFYVSGTGHLSPAFSCCDILCELYFDGIVDTSAIFSNNRDRVILSKGHAAAVLYAVLARAGYFERSELLTYYQRNTRLGGHPSTKLPGIETPTGALGHGICFATGTAKAAKLDGKTFRTYVILGDGESQEGSVWEAAEFAAKECLDNMTVILDNNHIQASDRTENIMPLRSVRSKWESFGWYVLETDGHNFDELHKAFMQAKSHTGSPVIIIAETVKGKGVSFIENNPDWHSRAPKGTEWDIICEELGITRKELERI